MPKTCLTELLLQQITLTKFPHSQTNKIRLLMRREQVHKICLNHNLKKGMDFRKKDDKTFYWATVDHSENTPKNETFAIRFKTPEIAVEFYKAVDSAKVWLWDFYGNRSKGYLIGTVVQC